MVNQHLRAGQVAVIVVTVIMGLTAILVARATTRRANRLTYEFVEQNREAHDLRFHVEQFTSATRGYLLSGAARYIALREEVRHHVGGDLDRVRAGRYNARHVEQAALLFDAYDDATIAALGRRDAVGDIGPIYDEIVRTVRPARLQLESHIATMLANEERALDAAFARGSRLSRAAQLALAATTIVLLVLGFVLTEALRRKLAEQFRAVEAATAAAERAAAERKELLSVVSHDLRSPLGAIMLNLELAATEDANRARLTSIQRSAERMQRLIEELLDVARVEGGQLQLYPANVDARELVLSLTPLFTAQAEARGVTLAIGGDAGSLRIDHDRILRVLCNLVDNALKFTPSGGRIRVSAIVTDDRARFEIADTGVGIAEEHRARVFERQWQRPVGRRAGGLGLGLYICAGLVSAHGGTIGVDSKPGAGSTFWFELPRVVSAVAG